MKNIKKCDCGGDIKMIGFTKGHYEYACNKCKAKYRILYISKK